MFQRLNLIKISHLQHLQKTTGVTMGFWRIIFTIILPPLGVLLGKGVGGAFLINILLTLLGYFPGLIHAFWVQTKN